MAAGSKRKEKKSPIQIKSLVQGKNSSVEKEVTGSESSHRFRKKSLVQKEVTASNKVAGSASERSRLFRMKSLVYKAATGSGRCPYSKKCQWLLKMQLFRCQVTGSARCHRSKRYVPLIMEDVAVQIDVMLVSQEYVIVQKDVMLVIRECHCSERCHVIHSWKMSNLE